MEFQISRARVHDWERVRAVRLRALEEDPDAFWVTAEEERQRTPDQWRERLAATTAATFLAAGNAGDVGLVVVFPSEWAPGDAGVAAMWVAPEARGIGAADALLSAAVDWARTSGYPRARLWVNDANQVAGRMYARHGFAPTGVTGTFPPPRDHLTEHELAVELEATGTQRRDRPSNRATAGLRRRDTRCSDGPDISEPS